MVVIYKKTVPIQVIMAQNFAILIIFVAILLWLQQKGPLTETFGLTMKAPVAVSRMSMPYGTTAAVPVYDHLSTANVTRGQTIMTSVLYGQGTMSDIVGTFDDPVVIANLFNRLSTSDKYYVATALLARFKMTSDVYKTQKNHDTFMYFIAPQLYVATLFTGIVNPTNRYVLPVWDLVSASLKLQYTAAT